MKLLTNKEFKDAQRWGKVIELSGFSYGWHHYQEKYRDTLELWGSNYDQYVKLFEYEATKLGRLLHGVDDDFTNAK